MIFLAIVLVLCSVGFPAAAAVDPDHLIVPGQGIGPVHLGDEIQSVINHLGQPKSVTRGGGFLEYSWAETQGLGQDSEIVRGGLKVTVKNDRVVSVLAYLDGSYQTVAGLRSATIDHGRAILGSRDSDVWAILGKPEKILQGPTLVYPGVYFAVYKGVVLWIEVTNLHVTLGAPSGHLKG